MHIIHNAPEIVVPIKMCIAMQGLYRFRLFDKFSGKTRFDTGMLPDVPNKILDSGRNAMNTESLWMRYCHIGTNNTAPTATDTQLLGFVVSTQDVVSGSEVNGPQANPPYFGWKRKTFRFDVGAGHGGQNLQEAGVGWGASGSTLVSRALIIDPYTQLPTTVTPLADEIMDVTYELRYYPPLVDLINSVTLNTVDYDTTTRASLVTNDIWSRYIGESIGVYAINNNIWRAFDGTIGTLTQAPNGTSANHNDYTQITNATYSNNSYEIVMQCPVGVGGWNLGAGIRSVGIQTTAGAFQTELSAASGGATVPKDINATMRLEWTLGWTEKV